MKATGGGRSAAAVGLFAALCLSATAPAFALERIDAEQALRRSEAAIGRTIGAHTLIDSAGAALPLRAYLGKPLVVSLIYTSCSSVCPPLTQHVVKAVGDARRVFGADRFEVLTIGFDARHDTPARLSQFATLQGIGKDHWKVASADAGTMDAVLRDLGFSYARVAGGFDHVAQTTIIDGEGRIYRQVYGDDFPVQMLVEPLRDLIEGTTSSLTLSGVLDRIRFICTTYDPGAGRYRLDYGLVFGAVIAALSLAAFAGLIAREWRRGRRVPGEPPRNAAA